MNMEAAEIRMINFQYLCDTKYSRAYVAEKMGYPDTNYVNQLCGSFGSFGTPTARKAEKAFDLTPGWMDNLHPSLYPDKVDRASWPLSTSQEYIDFFSSMTDSERAEAMAYVLGMRSSRQKP